MKITIWICFKCGEVYKKEKFFQKEVIFNSSELEEFSLIWGACHACASS